MKQPCDEAVIRSNGSPSPCQAASQSWVLAATILGSSLAFIDSTVVNVALPALQSSFHASVMDVQWVVESYGLFLSALILIGGALGDSLGRRLMFVLGVGLFALASAGCGFATSIDQLVIARCIQGIGAAFLIPSSLAIISSAFDDKSRGKAIGTWSGFTAMTTAFGPVMGGWLVEHASWHWVFFINIPLAAAVILISLAHIPESRSAAARRIDWLGALFATLGLGGLIYGFIESAGLGWGDVQVFGSLILAAIALILFVWIEARGTSPMVPFALFKSRSFSGANLLTLLLYAALGIFFFLFPMNLIQVHGYSATATGAAALPAIFLIFLLSRWSGGLVTRYGPRTPLMIGPLIVAAGFILFAVPSAGGSYWTTFFPAFVVLGFGLAISVAPLTTVVMSSVEQDRAGTASGINNAVARVAGVLAIAVLGVVMVAAFNHIFLHQISELNLDPTTLHRVQANAIKLAGIDVPADIPPATVAAIRQSAAAASLFAFRTIMLLCAALALFSAVAAWRLIPAIAVALKPDAGDPASEGQPAIAASQN